MSMVTVSTRFRRALAKHGLGGTIRVLVLRLVRRGFEVWPNARILWAQTASPGGEVVREVQGFRMKLDLSDVGISRELYLTGVHEASSTRQFRDELYPGMVLLEVGANIGYYALIAAQHIRPGGRVIALEPSPVSLHSLRENLRLNSVEHMVSIYPFAAGSRNEHLPFYVVSKRNLSGFINREGRGINLLSEIAVEVVQIDDVLDKEGAMIDYFRMDIEGFETEVVKGMGATLTAVPGPTGGFIEVHSRILNENGSSARSFMERMARLGYRIKTARFRGRSDVVVSSNGEFYAHPLSEEGYWETFFSRCRDQSCNRSQEQGSSV